MIPCQPRRIIDAAEGELGGGHFHRVTLALADDDSSVAGLSYRKRKPRGIGSSMGRIAAEI